MAAAPPPDPAVMIDELVEEFLLRMPPEDPALLARAALVSRQWYRVVTGPSFRRRFHTGGGVVFISTRVGRFTIDLKSGSCKKVGEYSEVCVVPYVSFCTPAPGAGVAISSEEVPVADSAVSTDEGPGAGVLVSADEGQELVACVKFLRSSNYKSKGL